jgi:hypothetical protein
MTAQYAKLDFYANTYGSNLEDLLNVVISHTVPAAGSVETLKRDITIAGGTSEEIYPDNNAALIHHTLIVNTGTVDITLTVRFNGGAGDVDTTIPAGLFAYLQRIDWVTTMPTVDCASGNTAYCTVWGWGT